MMLGATTSKALVNITTLLVLVGWLLGGRLREKWQIAYANPITLACLAIVLLVVVGATYTSAPSEWVQRHIYVYSRLLVVIVLLTIFDAPEWRRRALLAFLTGASITLVSTYANIWFELPWSESQATGLGASHHVFMDYIAQGLAMSFLTVIAIAHAVQASTRSASTLWWMAAIASAFSVTHLTQSRTAQIVLVAAVVAVLWLAIPKRWRWRASAFIAFMMVALLSSSPLVVSRFTDAIAEYHDYAATGNPSTSTGARLDMWRHSLEMVADRPILGHGTGAYRSLSEEVYRDPAICEVSCVHPHNQFLFFWVELGALGLIAYLLLLWRSLTTCATGRSSTERLILVGFVVIIGVDSFINAPLWVTTERLFFTSVLALVAAGPRRVTAETGPAGEHRSFA